MFKHPSIKDEDVTFVNVYIYIWAIISAVIINFIIIIPVSSLLPPPPPPPPSLQFFFTLRGDDLDHLAGKHTIFGEVAEGMEVLDALNLE
jgi:hypothetical protein